MKRSVNYSHLVGLSSADVVLPTKELPVRAKSEQDLVYDLVFAPDKRTGLPSSDISVYLSSKTPSAVREFIKQNILGEGLSRPSAPEGLDDDTLHELVRGQFETVDDYSQRVNAFLNRQREVVQEQFAADRLSQRQDNSNE